MFSNNLNIEYIEYMQALTGVLILDFKCLNPKHYISCACGRSFVQHWCCGCDGQEPLRRARSTALKTERRTSSWFWRTAWRSASATNPRSSSWSRKCSTFPRQATGRRWNKSSRAFWTGRRSGRPKSASHVSSGLQLSGISKFVTRAGKMSRNAQGKILSYRQKKWKLLILVEFEVFTKMCSLSPRLAIPMLQIIIKHLKLSLLVHFLAARLWQKS